MCLRTAALDSVQSANIEKEAAQTLRREAYLDKLRKSQAADAMSAEAEADTEAGASRPVSVYGGFDAPADSDDAGAAAAGGHGEGDRPPVSAAPAMSEATGGAADHDDDDEDDDEVVAGAAVFDEDDEDDDEEEGGGVPPQDTCVVPLVVWRGVVLMCVVPLVMWCRRARGQARPAAPPVHHVRRASHVRRSSHVLMIDAPDHCACVVASRVMVHRS